MSSPTLMTPEPLATAPVLLASGCNTRQDTSGIRTDEQIGPGGIDALDVRVPSSNRFSDNFQRLHAELEHKGKLRRGTQYVRTVDLSEYSIRAVLHERHMFTPSHDHKLELLGVGQMSAADIRREITDVFDVDPDALDVMRLDLFADVSDVPLSWFVQHSYAKGKRSLKQYGETTVQTTPFAVEVNNSVGTAQFGSGKDFFRCYDKSAKQRQDYRKERRAVDAVNLEAISFAERFGREADIVVTRIERQIRGRAVPNELSTVRLMLENAATFRPFERLAFLPGGVDEPDPNRYPLMLYLVGMAARTYIQKHGLAAFRSFVNRRSRNNAAKFFRRILNFIPADEDHFAMPDITALYQWGVRKQLLGSVDHAWITAV